MDEASKNACAGFLRYIPTYVACTSHLARVSQSAAASPWRLSSTAVLGQQGAHLTPHATHHTRHTLGAARGSLPGQPPRLPHPEPAPSCSPPASGLAGVEGPRVWLTRVVFARRLCPSVYGQRPRLALSWPTRRKPTLSCLIHSLGTPALTTCAHLRASAQLDVLPQPQSWDKMHVIELVYLGPAVRLPQAPLPEGSVG